MTHGQLCAFEGSSFHTSDGAIEKDGVIPSHVVAESTIGLVAFQTVSGTPFFPVHQRSEGRLDVECTVAVRNPHGHRCGSVDVILAHCARFGDVVLTCFFSEVEHPHAMGIGVVVARFTVCQRSRTVMVPNEYSPPVMNGLLGPSASHWSTGQGCRRLPRCLLPRRPQWQHWLQHFPQNHGAVAPQSSVAITSAICGTVTSPQ